MNVKLIEARRNKGLSQRSAAAAIGINRGVLAGAEGGAGVHPGHAKKIADFYELLVTDIWPVSQETAA